MIVNISKMKENDTIEVGFEKQYDVPKEYCIDFVRVTFSGTLTFNDDIYTLKGKAECYLEALCSSCLAAVNESFDFEVVETFTKTEYDEDTHVLEGYEIDTDVQVYQNLIMNLPLKIVCNDDCKGLCTKCGVNLNTSICNCESKGEINPKFEKLLTFFDESNN